MLLRVSIANEGPLPQADLLAIYRRLIASARALEAAERERLARGQDGPPNRRARDGEPIGATAPTPPTTRFAPAPTGRLHLGHLANAIFVWGLARREGGRVLLRIEDHDRQRCRPEYETALLDDLDRLGIAADEPSTDDLRRGSVVVPPERQRPPCTRRRSIASASAGLAYACDCTRSTFAAWRATHRASWSGPGCPGGCRERGPADRARARDPGRARRRRGELGGRPARAELRPGRARGRPAGRAIGTATGRTRCAWSSTTCATASISCPRRGPPRGDGAADPARPAPRARRAAELRPSPARTPSGRVEAEQGRRRDGNRRPARHRQHRRRPVRRGRASSRSARSRATDFL